LAKKYWLMNTEPDAFGWDDLKAAPGRTEMWDGVRNYQARNFMRDDMKPGDGVLFYHSRVNPPGIVGLASVTGKPYADPTQFDPDSKYYDPKSKTEDPRWWLVDIKAERDLTRPVSLPELKEIPGLEDMCVIQRGMRLSIQPVTAEEWKIIRAVGKPKAIG